MRVNEDENEKKGSKFFHHHPTLMK
jgi:hypothetical protein